MDIVSNLYLREKGNIDHTKQRELRLYPRNLGRHDDWPHYNLDKVLKNQTNGYFLLFSSDVKLK